MTSDRLLAQLVAILGAASTPRLTLSPEEAARALSMSRDSFDRHVKPELRLVRRGKLVLVPIRELEQWVEANSARTLEA